MNDKMNLATDGIAEVENVLSKIEMYVRLIKGSPDEPMVKQWKIQLQDEAEKLVSVTKKINEKKTEADLQNLQNLLDEGEKQGKKYILYSQKELSPIVDGCRRHVKLWRIVACKNFGDVSGYTVRKGDFGGFVESEENLSHEGTCWINKNAKAFGNARVTGDCWIDDNAIVCDNAKVDGHAMLCHNVQAFDFAEIHNDADLQDKVKVHGHVEVTGDAFAGGDWDFDGGEISGDYGRHGESED